MLAGKPFMLLVFRVLLVLAAAVPAAADTTDRITRVLPLAAGAPVSLQISIGRVQVAAWSRPELALEIVRRAPGRPELARIPVEVETAAGVRIRAVQPDAGRDATLRTDVVLRMPASAELREISIFEGTLELDGLTGAVAAHVERGDVLARNIGGRIRVETGMGDIRLDNATLSTDGLIRLRTFNGDVRLRLAKAPSDARILALSMGGSIRSDIPLTRRERWGPRWGEATLGRGEPVISIDVVNGNIDIAVAK